MLRCRGNDDPSLGDATEPSDDSSPTSPCKCSLAPPTTSSFAAMRLARLGVKPPRRGIFAGESGHAPARPLLDYRQARFSHRLLARSQDGGGPEEILEREEGAVVRKLRAVVGTKPEETVEL